MVNQPQNIAFGHWINAQRLQIKKSRSDLATILGVTPSAVTKLEAGKVIDPTTEQLTKIAEFLQKDFIEVLAALIESKYVSQFGPADSSGRELAGAIQISLAVAERIRKSKVKFASEVASTAIQTLITDELEQLSTTVPSRNRLSMQGLAFWEANLQGVSAFWIIAHKFLDTGDADFYKALRDNLSKGIRYTFFIPEELAKQGRDFDSLKKKLSKDLQATNVSAHLDVVTLDSTETISFIDDYVIAKINGIHVGFRCVRDDLAGVLLPTHAEELDFDQTQQLRDYIFKILDSKDLTENQKRIVFHE